MLWGQLVVFFSTCLALTNGLKNWYETPPDTDDKCTLVVISREKHGTVEVAAAPNCHQGALMWYAVTGRIHLEFNPSLEGDEFLFCLVSGLKEGAYFWWDSHQEYWQPITFPQDDTELDWWHKCRPSTNGTLDIYVETPWAVSGYLAYASWEMKPMKTSTYARLYHYMDARRKPTLDYEDPGFDFDADDDDEEEEKEAVNNNENKEFDRYSSEVLDVVGGYLTVVIPAACVGIVVVSLWLKAKASTADTIQEDTPTENAGKKKRKSKKIED